MFVIIIQSIHGLRISRRRSTCTRKAIFYQNYKKGYRIDMAMDNSSRPDVSLFDYYITAQFSSSFFLSRVNFPCIALLLFPPLRSSSSLSRARGNWKAVMIESGQQ